MRHVLSCPSIRFSIESEGESAQNSAAKVLVKIAGVLLPNIKPRGSSSMSVCYEDVGMTALESPVGLLADIMLIQLRQT
jgi:hypothetical protein